jgi:hypothetical protein
MKTSPPPTQLGGAETVEKTRHGCGQRIAADLNADAVSNQVGQA